MSRKMILFFVVILLVLSACSPAQTTQETMPQDAPTAEVLEEAQPETITVTDDLGKTIELEGYPQAIVSLSPSTTEILFAIGAGDQLVGRDEYSLFPEAALEVTNIGSMFGGIPTEAILALEPDLVLAAEIITQEQVKALEDLGLTVYWQANPLDFDGLYRMLLDIAELTGHVDETNALIDSLKDRVAAVVDAVSAAEATPVVFYEFDATDPANPWTAGGGTFIDYIITMAGGLNVAADLESYPQISVEQLINRNPDVILLADALYGTTAESVAQRAGWKSMSAVSNNAIYPIDPNMMSVPGPRLVDALEETARLLHPELFK